ncbi:MAG: TIGR02757 family protein [Rhodothermaceae bacterium]|nr:TIGR02757 family protein [Rhodothermaceae bacterium]
MQAGKRKLKTISAGKLRELKPWLDDMAARIEQPGYIEKDPVCFMHAFQEKNDREIAGFLAAIMAWGRRDIILRKVDDLLARMDYQPAEFTGNYTDPDSLRFSGFRHRTFTESDLHWLIQSLNTVLQRYGSIEGLWQEAFNVAGNTGPDMITAFHNRFFGEHFAGPQRVRKHVSTGEKMSSCKRLWLYLRWCIRKNSVVDPGTMSFISPSHLMIPLDVHVARHARRLGLLERQANDWLAADELTTRLRQLDPEDPARYDYALFGVGISEEAVPSRFLLNAWYK